MASAYEVAVAVAKFFCGPYVDGHTDPGRLLAKTLLLVGLFVHLDIVRAWERLAVSVAVQLVTVTVLLVVLQSGVASLLLLASLMLVKNMMLRVSMVTLLW